VADVEISAPLETYKDTTTAPSSRMPCTSEVSASLPKKSRPYCRSAKHPAPVVPEVVRIQRALLEVNCVEIDVDTKAWTLAHVLRESINLVSKEKMLHVRYADRHEQVVCEGAVHRPTKYIGMKKPSLRLKDLTAVAARQRPRSESPPPPRDGHVSSLDEFTDSDGGDDDVPHLASRSSGSGSDSDRTVSDSCLRSLSLEDAGGNRRSPPPSPRSEATVSDGFSAGVGIRRRRGRPPSMRQRLPPVQSKDRREGLREGNGGIGHALGCADLGTRDARCVGPHAIRAPEVAPNMSAVARTKGGQGSPPQTPSSPDSWYHLPAPKVRMRGKGRGCGRGKAVGQQGKDKGGRAGAGDRKKRGMDSMRGAVAIGAGVTPVLDPFAQRFALHTWTKSTHAYDSPPWSLRGLNQVALIHTVGYHR
jgi:hypothetical protein